MRTLMLGKSNGRQAARIVLGLVLAFAVILSPGAMRWRAAAQPQAPTIPSKTMPETPMESMPGMPDNSKDRLEGQRARIWNDERHKKLVSDTDKLLQLATELKTEVDKSTRNELSVKVIQKAAEIEKLSHEVKERMKS